MTLQKYDASNSLASEIIEQVVIGGDLEKLTPGQRLSYYQAVCDSIGVNPLTKPFAYIRLNGKLTLYAQRDCTDQLRRIHGVNITITAREVINEVYVVTARAAMKDGRTDESTGAVPITALKGESLANAYMKAETKAKRRVTLSVVGLGWLDETETVTVAGAQPVTVDEATGEIIEPVRERAVAPTPKPDPKPVKLANEWSPASWAALVTWATSAEQGYGSEKAVLEGLRSLTRAEAEMMHTTPRDAVQYLTQRRKAEAEG